MYVDILCCPKCGHELYVIALYSNPPQYKYECRNPNCDYGKEYSFLVDTQSPCALGE